MVTFLAVLLMAFTFRNCLGLLESAIMLRTSMYKKKCLTAKLLQQGYQYHNKLLVFSFTGSFINLIDILVTSNDLKRSVKLDMTRLVPVKIKVTNGQKLVQSQLNFNSRLFSIYAYHTGLFTHNILVTCAYIRVS